MQRRAFIEHLSSTFAAAGAVSLQSCGSTKGRYLRSPKLIDVEKMVHHIDSINDRVNKDSFFSVPSQYLANHGCSPNLFRESIQALLLIGAFGDISVEQQKHPLIQKRLIENAGLLDRTILGMTTHLESIPLLQRNKISDELKANPHLMYPFQTVFEKESRNNKVPYARVSHFHTLVNRVTRSLQRRTGSTIIDEYIEKVDKVALQNGITKVIRRDLAKKWDEDFVVSLFENSAEYRGPDFLLGSVSLQKGGDSGQSLSKKQRRLRAGQKLMGIGGVILGAGTVFLIVGVSGENFLFLIPAAISGTVGAIVLIIGVVTTIVGSVTGRKNTHEILQNKKMVRQKDRVYQKKLKEAVAWIEHEKNNSDQDVETLILNAMEKFNVEYNDIWEILE